MLNGWKAIAAHLRREERTAMRWAKERGMPVHRLPGEGRGSVYALADEIDAWLLGVLEERSVPPSEITDAQAGSEVVQTQSEPSSRGIRFKPGMAWLALALAAAVGIAVSLEGMSRRDRGHLSVAIPVLDPGLAASLRQAQFDFSLRTQASLERASQEFGAIVAREPRATAAYTGLAETYLLQREYGNLADNIAYPRAEAAARAALAIDPSSAAAYRDLAFVDFWWRCERVKARQAFARALKLAPQDSLTHHWFATALLANGEGPSALREIDEAQKLEPNSVPIAVDRALMYLILADRVQGRRAMEALAADQPNNVDVHRYLANFAILEGRAADYLREEGLVAQLTGDVQQQRWVRALQSAHANAASVRSALLTALRSRSPDDVNKNFDLAEIEALDGDRQGAVVSLARACRLHEPATARVASSLWIKHSLSSEDVSTVCPITALS